LRYTYDDERHGQFSPDGHFVAYATNESGRFEIIVQPFPSLTGKWQVSTAGGIEPRWRGDGRELYFIAPDGKLMMASVTASAGAFTASPPVALFQTRIRGGGTAGPSKHQYAVSRDGRFLIIEPADAGLLAPITVILNWNPRQ
jgi:Tol biopolymer transport system component